MICVFFFLLCMVVTLGGSMVVTHDGYLCAHLFCAASKLCILCQTISMHSCKIQYENIVPA